MAKMGIIKIMYIFVKFRFYIYSLSNSFIQSNLEYKWNTNDLS